MFTDEGGVVLVSLGVCGGGVAGEKLLKFVERERERGRKKFAPFSALSSSFKGECGWIHWIGGRAGSRLVLPSLSVSLSLGDGGSRRQYAGNDGDSLQTLEM